MHLEHLKFSGSPCDSNVRSWEMLLLKHWFSHSQSNSKHHCIKLFHMIPSPSGMIRNRGVLPSTQCGQFHWWTPMKPPLGTHAFGCVLWFWLGMAKDLYWPRHEIALMLWGLSLKSSSPCCLVDHALKVSPVRKKDHLEGSCRVRYLVEENQEAPAKADWR